MWFLFRNATWLSPYRVQKGSAQAPLALSVPAEGCEHVDSPGVL